jgi:hypothetical protein
MDAIHPEQERTKLFVVLTGLTLTAAVGLLVMRAHVLVSLWVLAAIALPWIAFSIYLRLHRDGIGGEGRYVDWWTVPHGIGGLLLGVFDIGLVWVVALVVWWECVEAASRVYEHFTNRVSDVVVAVAGWTFAQLVLTGGVRAF